MNASRIAALTLALVFVGAAPLFAAYVDALDNTGGLISHWDLNETSGTAADRITTDAIDGDNPGTYSGAGYTLGDAGPTPATGFWGFTGVNKAPTFSGTTTQLLSMSPTGYAGLTDLSLSTWFRFDAGTSENHIGGLEDTSGYRYVFGTHQYGSSPSPYIKRSDGTQTQVNGGPITDDRWHHYALTYQTTGDLVNGGYDGTLSVYVDGQLKQAGTANLSAALGLDAADTLVFARDAGAASRNLNGQLDEIAFFDKPLTAAEVDNQFVAGTSAFVSKVNELGPVHYWRFSETTGTAAADAIGGKDGRYSGSGYALGQPGPRPSDGIFGVPEGNVAPEFSAGDDRLSFADPDLLGPSKSFSGTGVDELSMGLAFRLDNTTNEQILAGYTNTGESTRYNFLAMSTSSGVRFYLKDIAGDQIISTVSDFTITDNDWHYLTMVWDGTGENELRVYLDGADSETVLDNVSVSGDLFAPNTLVAGEDGVGARDLDGQVDELAIFDYALSYDQVDQLYSAAMVPEPGALTLVLGVVVMALARRRRGR